MAEEAREDAEPGEGAPSAAGSSGQAREARPGVDADGREAAGRSRRRPAAAAVIAAAAAGTTAVAANRVLKARGGRVEAGETAGGGAGAAESGQSLVSRAAQTASRRGEPIVQALVQTGWDAVKTNIAPVAERAAGAAGSFAATEAPEFVRETLLPPFVKAYEEARRKQGEGGG